VNLTTYLHLVLRLRINGVVPFFPSYAFIGLTGTPLPRPLLVFFFYCLLRIINLEAPLYAGSSSAFHHALHLGSNIFLSSLVSNRPSLCCSFNVQAKFQTHTRGKRIVLYILIYTFLGAKLAERRRFWSEFVYPFPEFNLIVYVVCHFFVRRISHRYALIVPAFCSRGLNNMCWYINALHEIVTWVSARI